MKIDLTCPVELWQYTTPTENSPECAFVLNNLSDKVVISVQVTLVCNADGDRLLFRQMERVQGLNAGSGERFSVSLLPSQWEGVKAIDLVIEKVWFDDATIWRRGSAVLTEYEPNTLPPGRRLDQLRFVAGPDAVGYPALQPHVWLCVCGRANDLHTDRCCRCERRRDTVFATCSRENVDLLIAVHEQKLRDVAKAAREEASRMAEEREKAQLREKKKKHTARVAGIAALCVTLAAGATLLWGIPAIRYARAGSLLAGGNYDAARTAFTELGTYSDAAAQLQECDYRQAGALAATADTASMQQAIDLYASLKSYKDSALLAQQTQYALGKAQMAAGRYELAADAFQALGSYSDSTTQRMETQYLQAQQMLQAESYTGARILFADLGTYKDSAAQVKLCDYQVGAAALDTKDYQTAVDRLTAAGDAQDAPTLLKQASYLLAEQLQSAGEYEKAGQLYKQAGDYEDALLKANNSLYELARERMNAGDYAKAAALYQSIVPYLDSETLGWECVYRQALADAGAGEDKKAIELLLTIPKHTQGAVLLKQSRYRLAAKYESEGKQQEALDLFTALGDYEDAGAQVRRLRYALAETAFNAGDFATAAPLYEALGKYEDSIAKLRQSRYAVANAAVASRDYEKAVQMFAVLGDYQDSKKQLENATYQLALNLKTSGDMQAAIKLLQTLPDNTDAKNQLSEITLSEADQAKASGDLQKAAELYLALGNYATAKDSYNAVRYQLAAQKKQAGDFRAAAPLFAALGDYQDAAAQAEQCNYEAYDKYAVPARAAYENGNWKTVVDTLAGFNAVGLPATYRDLSGMYEEACYNYAEELYNAGKVYEALPYYQRIPAYRDVTAKKLQRRSYLILGQWKNVDGNKTAEFRSDGTCTLFGAELHFAVDGYGLKTGATADALTLTHKLTTLTQNALSLRVLADGNNAVYPLTRVGNSVLSATPAPTPTATPAPTTDSWEVDSAN